MIKLSNIHKAFGNNRVRKCFEVGFNIPKSHYRDLNANKDENPDTESARYLVVTRQLHP